jgi:hypothetical protein
MMHGVFTTLIEELGESAGSGQVVESFTDRIVESFGRPLRRMARDITKRPMEHAHEKKRNAQARQQASIALTKIHFHLLGKFFQLCL